MRTFLIGVVLSLTLCISVGIALGQSDPVGVCKDPRGCDPPSSGGAGNTTRGPSIWDMMRANREKKDFEAREKRLKEAHDANERGVAAYNRGDYDTALKEFTEATQKNPDNQTMKKNLENTKTALQDRRNDEAKWAAEAAERAKTSGDTAKKMTTSMQSLADSLTAAPSASGLDFGDPKNSGLKDSPSSLNYVGALTAGPCGSSVGISVGSTGTVDARCVSSGLGKAVDEQLAAEFKGAPAGVADRVRKGFQSIVSEDWRATRAWFQDALRLDPDNKGLQRLVGLSEYMVAGPPAKAAIPDAPKPTMTQGEQQALLKLFEDTEDKILDDLINDGLNKFYLDYVPKHPELGIDVSVVPKAPSAPKPLNIEEIRKKLTEFVDPGHLRTRVTAVLAVRG